MFMSVHVFSWIFSPLLSPIINRFGHNDFPVAVVVPVPGIVGESRFWFSATSAAAGFSPAPMSI